MSDGEVWGGRAEATIGPMVLRRLVWTGLYAAIAAGASIAARRAAARIWRAATGEEPPART